MSIIYSVKCSLNTQFNFSNIENIITKKSCNISKFLDCINYEEIPNPSQVIEHLKHMQKAGESISVYITSDKQYQGYILSFYDFTDNLRVGLKPDPDRKDFLYDAYYPDMALYMKILLDMVSDYTILNIKIGSF